MANTVGKASPSRSILSALRRYWWAVLAALATSLGVSILYLIVTPSLYQASVRLNVNDKTVSLSSVGQTLSSNKKVGASDPVVVQAELVKSQGVLERGLEIYRAEVGDIETPTAKWLQRNIQVKIVPATSILDLSYVGEDPDQVAQLLNAIGKAAVADNTEFIRQEASTLKKFLEGQIPALATQLAQVSKAESQYQNRYSPFPGDLQAGQFAKELTALEQEESSLLASLKENLTKDRQLRQVTGITEQGAAYNAVQAGQDPQLKTLDAQLTKLRTTIAEARSRLSDQHPDMLNLLDEQEDLNTLYRQRLAQLTNTTSTNPVVATNSLSQELMTQYLNGQVQRYGLESRLRVVQEQIAQRRSRAAKQPLLQQPLADITRQKEEVTARLNLLNRKLEEARLAEAQLISNIRIVGQAEKPNSPISPKPLATLVIGLFAGGVLAAGSVLLLDALDNSLRNSAEVENLVDLPVLGNLGKIPTHLLTAAELDAFLDNSDWIEPYRSLLKNLEPQYLAELSARPLTNEDDTYPPQPFLIPSVSQIITLSSITGSEGKSAVTLFLGAVAAMLGRRTLIIEADPLATVHRYLKVQSQPGLAEIIHQQKSYTDSIQSTSLSRLDLLPYGQQLERPSTLSESELLRGVLAEVREQYDLVLIEAPPASRSADAATLSCITSGLLLIARLNFTSRNAIFSTVEQLRRNSAQLLGIALNETVPPQEGNVVTSSSLPSDQQRSLSQLVSR
ncbi:MAG: AAA family ATPase [Leptolyngbyaceae cyanobacterium MAG.088]|nr:AAA family ATPase [Leptolyngbyaceae cyanobacterium MAG.088]